MKLEEIFEAMMNDFEVRLTDIAESRWKIPHPIKFKISSMSWNKVELISESHLILKGVNHTDIRKV